MDESVCDLKVCTAGEGFIGHRGLLNPSLGRASSVAWLRRFGIERRYLGNFADSRRREEFKVAWERMIS